MSLHIGSVGPGFYSGFPEGSAIRSLLGGVLIGVSASLAWSGARQIAGISGIVGRFLQCPFSGDFSAWFLAALLGVGFVFGRFAGVWRATSLEARPLGCVLIAGLLVGFGTQLANGCTSGHGVCGLSRLSMRSLVATLTFMLAAAAVVFVTRHALAGVLR